uniref:Uncharacterized protein n=1 Tax=Timema genevievae TaxID=629358 RepID=A0A7R9JW27_TIMGE|nr:unnamed protein product [Timema genevievae]
MVCPFYTWDSLDVCKASQRSGLYFLSLPSTTPWVRIPTWSTTLAPRGTGAPRDIRKPARDCVDVSERTFSRMFCTWRCRSSLVRSQTCSLPLQTSLACPQHSTWGTTSV